MSNKEQAVPDNSQAEATVNATIILDTPIVRGEQTITTVVLRKPVSGELRGLKLADLLQLDVSTLQTLLPRISSPTLTHADAANLDPADLVQVGTAVAGFFMTRAERAASQLA